MKSLPSITSIFGLYYGNAVLRAACFTLLTTLQQYAAHFTWEISFETTVVE